MPLSSNPLTPSLYFHSHISVVYTTLSLSLQPASSLGLMCFLCWDVNQIEHQRQLVVPLLCCPKQMTKLVMKLHVLNLSHFPSRSTSKNVFLGFEKCCRRWVAVGLDLKSVQVQMIFCLDVEKMIRIFQNDFTLFYILYF